MKVFISPVMLLFITVSLLTGSLPLKAIIFVFPVEIIVATKTFKNANF
jgi:hypothetical protein